MNIHHITTEIVAEVLERDEPLTSNQIGEALRVYDGRSWRFPAYQRVVAALTELRNHGKAVKLPHEGVRAGATYTLCDDHQQATRMQRASTEALLAKIPLDQRGSLRARMLIQALVGLRAMVAADAEVDPSDGPR